MTDATDESPLKFPTELPIKVFGRNEQGFRDAVLTIVERHYGLEYRLSEQLSKQGSYLSLTVTVRAETRAQADAIFRELTAHDDILMVL